MTMDEIRQLSPDERQSALGACADHDQSLGLLLQYHLSLDWAPGEGRWHVLAEHPTAGVQTLVAYHAADVPALIERLALWVATQTPAADPVL